MKFSQRISKTPIRQSLQVESIDDDLKNAIWSLIFELCFTDLGEWVTGCTDSQQRFFKYLWRSFYKLPIDTMHYKADKVVQHVRDWYFRAEWYEIFDLIEAICQFGDADYTRDSAIVFNAILAHEMSAYRIVDGLIIQVTDETELREIEAAIEASNTTKLSGVSEHLHSALAKLADRKNPDFRNSIKESISAVESIAKLIAGNPKAQLGEALKAIEDKVGLHPALKKGFSAIYGYTSDQEGIRHALIDNSTSSKFEDAKYMLVACAAFVNYLKVKAIKAGIKM
jgi:hypothetical protein